MKRLGYTRYVAQGGDWGAVVVDLMAIQENPDLIGIHTNMAGAVPPEIDKLAQAGAPAPAGLSADEKVAYDMLVFTYKNVQYAFYMASRPQTLYGIADSPVGLAAWLLDHDPRSLEMIARSFDGVREGLTPDDVLWVRTRMAAASSSCVPVATKTTVGTGASPPRRCALPRGPRACASCHPRATTRYPTPWSFRAAAVG
jgi:hypothetical protein